MLIGYEDKNWSTIGLLEMPEEITTFSKTLLILITGHAGHKSGFRRMFYKFCKLATQIGFSVFRFDLPGDGESFCYVKIENFDEWIHDLILSIKKQHQFEKIILIGNCLGGTIGMDIVKNHPDTIDRFVFWDIYELFHEPGGFISKFTFNKNIKAYQQKALKSSTWIKLVKGQINWKKVYQYTIARLFNKVRVVARKKLLPIFIKLKYLNKKGKRVLIFYDALREDLEQTIAGFNERCRELNLISDIRMNNSITYSLEWQDEIFGKTLDWIQKTN